MTVLIREAHTEERHHMEMEPLPLSQGTPQDGTDRLVASGGGSAAHSPRSPWTGHRKLIVRYGFIF